MPALGLQTYIWNNNIRSVLLLIGFPVLLLGMVFFLTLGMIWAGMLPPGESAGGDVAEALSLMWSAAPLAIGVAVVWFIFAYFFNQAIIDFATGSRPLTREEEPRAYNLLENLCISRGLNMPTLRVIETDEMNAFASGLHEGRFSVTVTRGILEAMSDEELEAVLGHELTHIINRDVRTMVIASIFAGIITLMCQIIYRSIMWGSFGGLRSRRSGNVGVFMLVALVVGAIGYVLAIVIRMAISRSREYVADAGSVELTKNPDAMISALRRISGHAHLDAPQSMRAMFLEDDDEGVMGLFATHPPVEKRVQALMQYAGGRDVEPAPAPPPQQPIAETPESPGPPGPDQQGPWGQRREAPPGPWG
ncbi:MAG TPA: M48 family metallopeptidase [Caulobacteraceae bacterium]